MLAKKNPTQTRAWKELQKYFGHFQDVHMLSLFAEDPQRAESMRVQHEDMMLDYSKNRIDQQGLDLLMELAQECELADAIKAQFNGSKINETENRAVLHTALRAGKSAEPLLVDGQDIRPEIQSVLDKMRDLSERIRGGSWKGYTGKRIRQVVNIGIGGSDLGPYMATQAMQYYADEIEIYFVSNIDAAPLAQVLEKVNPEECLFLVASKTFTTMETMTNAYSARAWFLEHAEEKDIARHFIALSTNRESVIEFGIDPDNMLVFWDWVGGRYSLWSAIGFSIVLYIGYENFEKMLAGAASMDKHFQEAEGKENMPLIMALLGLWYNNFFGFESHCIVPYDHGLHRFPAFLQQSDMESNGKYVSRDGQEVHYQTGPIIWGEPGTNGQHAFFQLLHQGKKITPIDFIIPAQSHYPIGDHHEKLVANCIAQAQAMMQGKSTEEVIAEMQAKGNDEDKIEQLKQHRTFKGNRPSNFLMMKKLDPYNLGALIALYEHKIFVQGLIWNIFSFDQWGVELGKQLAVGILPKLSEENPSTEYDTSTNALIDHYKNWK
jgi:glucose-6-phosphate isomerase